MANDVNTNVVVKYQSDGADKVNDDLKKTQTGLDGVSRSGGDVEKATLSITNSFKALERQLGTTEGNVQKFAKVQDIANKMVAQNPEAQGRANEVLAQAAARYGQLGEATKGLDAYGQSALHSMRSLVEQIAIGASPMQALTAQMNHLSFAASGEGGIVGAFKQVGSMIAGFATPLNVAVAGVAGLTAAVALLAQKWADVQKNAEMAISNAGARTGTTVSDLNKFASQQSMPGGLTETEARKLGEDMTKTGEIVISQLHDMGTAVQGFANITHTSVADAEKAWVSFAQDPQKALDELAKTYGDFSNATKIAVDQLVQAGNKTGAINVITDELTQKNLKATEATTLLSKAYEGWLYLLGKQAIKPTGIEEEIAKIKQQLDEVIELAPKLEGAYQLQGASEKIAALSRKLEDLQAAQQKVLAQNMAGEMNHLAAEADKATAALVPQVTQIEQLQQKIADLNRAQAAGVTSKYGGGADAAALQAAQNQLEALKDSEATAARYNQQVAEVSKQWGNVGQATAMALQQQQNMLPVVEAVGGAAKLAAQYQADYNNAILQGKSQEEATAIAAMNRATAQAQINAQAKETLFSLQNQYQVAAAVTGAEQMQAQAEATYNQLVHDGVSAKIAAQVAEQQLANAQAQATANVMRQTEALKDQTAMIYAQQRGTEAQTASAIAYKNAIESGADAGAAAALSAATLANYMARASQSTKDMYQGMFAIAGMASTFQSLGVPYAPNYATGGGSDTGTHPYGGFDAGATGVSVLTEQGSQLQWQYNLQQQAAANAKSFDDQVAAAYQSGGINAALTLAQAQQAHAAVLGKPTMSVTGQTSWEDWSKTSPVISQAVTESDIIGQVTSLYDQQRSGMSQAQQAASMQAEMTWLQSRSASAQRDSAISQLKQSMDQLTKSTNDLNATNQDLLSPYYTQDPRTSHIGFRSQGMAQGGYVDVPGAVSANDNMIATVPVASGERIYIDPMYSRRGLSAGANFTINVSSPVMFAGNPDKDQVGRTMYQNNQNLVKQIRSAMQ